MAGTNVALITDAGTPGISDPGEELVKFCLEAGIEVTSLPGPAACITALTMSGLSTRRFCFEGFLPADKKERAVVLDRLKTETRTTVMYEAPHRLVKTLELLRPVLENRKIVFCKELTKKYEKRMAMTAEQALDFYRNNEPRGEYVLVVEGLDPKALVHARQAEWERMSVSEHVRMYMDQGMSKKEAMKKAAADRGIGKREIYQALLNEDK